MWLMHIQIRERERASFVYNCFVLFIFTISLFSCQLMNDCVLCIYICMGVWKVGAWGVLKGVVSIV